MLLALALALRASLLVPWSLALAAAGYLTGRAGDGGVDLWTPAAGAALLVAAELAYWAIEHDGRIRVERPVTLARAASVAGLAVAGAAAGLLLLPAGSLDAAPGLPLAAAGVIAAVAAVGLAVRLARPPDRRAPD